MHLGLYHSMIGHMTDMCPSIQEGGSYEQANTLGGFQGQQIFKEHLGHAMTLILIPTIPVGGTTLIFLMLITQTKQPLPCHTISFLVSHNLGNPKLTNHLHLFKPHHLAKTPYLKS